MKKIILLIIIDLLLFGCDNLKKDRNKLLIALQENHGYVFYDKNHNITGFTIDVSNLICEKIKMKCEFNILNFKEIFGSINNNINDIGAGFIKTKEREKNFLFSIPYIKTSLCILKYNKDYINKIGIISGRVEDIYVGENFEKEKIIYFDNINQKFQAFKSKNIDSLIEFCNVIALYLKEVKFNDEVFYKEIKNQKFEICFIVKKNNSLLKKKIDNAINILINDGSIDKLKKKYGLN